MIYCGSDELLVALKVRNPIRFSPVTIHFFMKISQGSPKLTCHEADERLPKVASTNFIDKPTVEIERFCY